MSVGNTEEPIVIGQKYEDKTLQCIECSHTFVWKAKEQFIYAKYKYQQPKRCKACRILKKERMLAHENSVKRDVTYR